ncbi:MAG TPA: response regulator transcription factor [Puia sp.]|jgi:DNA-binding NarL/FixJ family response regulator
MSDLSIFIISDQLLFRQGLKMMLKDQEGFEILQDLGRTMPAIEAVRKWQPRIVLFDISIRSEEEPDYRSFLGPIAVHSKIVLLCSEFPDRRMIGHEVTAFHSVNSSGRALKALLRKVAGGYRQDLPVDDTDAATPEMVTPRSLSTRELEIASLVTRGLTSKEIGTKLTISVKTVEVHRHNILKKLQLPNTVALVNLMTTEYQRKQVMY